MNLKKITCLVAISAIAMGLLTGCGAAKVNSGSEETQANVPTSSNVDTVLITTIRANQPLPNTSVISEASTDTCEYGGDFYLITSDGDPVIKAHASYEGVSVFGNSERTSQLATLTDEIVQQVGQKCKAETPESDLLGAINIAASIFSDSPNAKELVIYDNCISTTGAITLQDSSTGLAAIDLDGLIADLKENHEIPALNGVAVDIFGAAITSLPQMDLSNTEQELLQNFWQTIFEEAGAASVTFHSITNVQSSEAVKGLPEVSVIPVNQTGNYVAKNLITEPITFDETAVAFENNSNQLVDIESAKVALQEVANILKEYPQDVYIAATTAYDANTAGCIERAEGRANTIYDLLADMGIDQSYLHAAPLGCAGPFYIEENGSEEIAKTNRTVTIVACSSDIGQEIKAFLDQ